MSRRAGVLVRDLGLILSWVVQLSVAGDSDSWPGVLEGWDERGVVVRYTEDMVRFAAENRAGEGPSKPMMLLFPWPALRYVGIELENLEES